MCCSQITLLPYVIPKKEDTPPYKICSSNSTINEIANSDTRCTKSAHTMVFNILIQVFMYVFLFLFVQVPLNLFLCFLYSLLGSHLQSLP